MERQPKETLYEYLARRATELTHEIAALQGEINVRQQELAHIDSAKRQIDFMGGQDAARFGKRDAGKEGVTATDMVGEIEGPRISQDTGDKFERLAESIYTIDSGIRKTVRAFAEVGERYPFLQFEHLTIKQLILKALTDHFADGAAVTELRDFIRNAYGRNIERSSLASQMSKLKEDGAVEYFQRANPDGNDVESSNTFIVAKAFNSHIRRFPVGAEIAIPTDEAELKILKAELEPRDLEDLKNRRWIVAPGVGYWRLARTELKLIEGKAD